MDLCVGLSINLPTVRETDICIRKRQMNGSTDRLMDGWMDPSMIHPWINQWIHPFIDGSIHPSIHPSLYLSRLGTGQNYLFILSTYLFYTVDHIFRLSSPGPKSDLIKVTFMRSVVVRSCN